MSILFPVNRVAAEAGLPFFFYVFAYALAAGLVVVILAAWRGQVPPLRRDRIRAHVVAGALGFVLPFSILAFVASKLPSGIAALLLVLTPVFTYVIALLAKVETFRVSSSLGLTLAVAGILLIVIPSQALPAAGMQGWFILALLAPVSFAVLNVTVEISTPPQTPPLALAAGVLLTGAVGLLPMVILTGQFSEISNLNATAIFILAAATGVNIIMWPLFYLIVDKAGAFQFSVMNIVALLGAIIWGIVFFAEQHSIYIWTAMALMLAGFFMTFARRRAR